MRNIGKTAGRTYKFKLIRNKETRSFRSIIYYGHVTRTSSQRQTNRLYSYFVNKKAIEVEKDLQEVGIASGYIQEHVPLQKRL